MKNKALVLITLLITIAIGLLACGTTAALDDTAWVLESYGEPGNLQAVLEDTQVTAQFADGEIRGSAGCNTYFGGYETDNDKISIPLLANTEMWCEGKMDQEQEFLSILNAAESYTVESDQLRISGDGKVLIFNRR
jgi:heat shock protein HslJ